MELGNEILKKCKEVWVYGIQNPSEGMKAEMDLAKKIGIPVRDAVEIYGEMMLKRTNSRR
ncbi:MAG: hypothetical protein APF81_08395 [Desulfosporosinus sp. BRH_c37]|nr:MAG: hypothetical protein APF81_08395 [Desulfosporosinus sp. BRH_c37]